MDLATFLRQRRDDWRRLEGLLARAEGSGLPGLGDEGAVELGALYRRASADLNQAQTFVRGEGTERYLNGLVARAYLVIHGRRRPDPLGALGWFLAAYPAVFRRHAPHLALALGLFAAGAAFGFLASWYDPAAARPFLLPAEMPTIQPPRVGEPDPTPLQTTGEFAAFSSHLFTNNVRRPRPRPESGLQDLR